MTRTLGTLGPLLGTAHREHREEATAALVLATLARGRTAVLQARSRTEAATILTQVQRLAQRAPRRVTFTVTVEESGKTTLVPAP